MRKIYPLLSQIRRTEHKDWQTRKVKTLMNLLNEGRREFCSEPVYLVPDSRNPFRCLVYDGNTRHFLAEKGMISLDNYYLLETDDDLEEVRRRMQEIYWPGNDLECVVGYLSSRKMWLDKETVAR